MALFIKDRKMAKEKGMISEDRGSMCNLPQQVVIKPYPTVDFGMTSSYNDKISGIDNQIKNDSNGKKRSR